MDTEPQVVYNRAKKLSQAIDYQLQQLEHQDGALLSASSSAADDGREQRCSAIVENVNRLTAETALLEKVIRQCNTNGTFTSSEKRELWNKCVTCLFTAQLSEH